ncbi:site-2 protease family protein [Engelhardtia mirabilis]|uniref:Regulator of sigma-E protease RseP n=1 Tax=Engelhardtia mirabilis TaxID=2528011 RepID=A0A518BKQ8_9BACT|nr:Regulator of sigma-E protease RseP [Planctomycetes bacterium Pla133]QDV01885.1 Regulator of sigma-E protease RseP [Planctomycetes bacterium Pla86]
MIDLFRVLQAAIGIGLVIFVHEAGHFLAARWCGVRVHVFSLGMGPKLFGIKRGHTTYQLAVIPVGGFVSMAGELPDGSGRAPESWELPAKSVGQRFLVYSGGVLMNMGLALVLFPILFWSGVPFSKPAIGTPDPGGPAWRAGLTNGTEIVAVNGHSVLDGLHVATEIALGDRDRVELLVRDPGSTSTRKVVVEPEHDERMGFNSIGLGRPALDPEHRIDVAEDTPAWRAGLRPGDRLQNVDGLPAAMQLEDQLRVAMQDRSPLELTVLRKSDGSPLTVSIQPDLKEGPGRPRLGILPALCVVAALRPGPATDELGLRVDDALIAIGDRRILQRGDLPLAWLAAEPDEPLVIARDGGRLAIDRPQLDDATLFAMVDDIALALDYETLRLSVAAGEGAEQAGLRGGDRLLAIDGRAEPTWVEVFEIVRTAAEEERNVELRVERTSFATEPAPQILTIVAAPIPQADPVDDGRYNEFGFGANVWEYTYRADGPLDAVRVGLATSWQYVKQTWLTLRGMMVAEISTKNIGGPVAIGQISYAFAESGWAKLMYFLCLLSVNLAIINVLPIPVFDGGHLLFLLIEKVKGSPVSERVVGYSQLVGVVFVVGLFVYVTYNDIARAFGL